jgi:nicotinamide-nucleotide amidase
MGINELGAALRARGMKLATAESCTGGMIGAALTDVAGSSNYFERGFITYSNESKHELLGVSADILRSHGAVSAETAAEMVAGALHHSRADIAVAVTGIAGPGGGSAEKPVGTVYIGWGVRGQPCVTAHHLFDGDRADVRRQTVDAAIHHLLKAIE